MRIFDFVKRDRRIPIEIQNVEALLKPEGEALPCHVSEVKDNLPAIVTVVSDDGVYRSCVILDRLAQRHNLHFTVAGTVNNIIEHEDDWHGLLRRGTLELVSHSYTHLKIADDRCISQEQLEHEIKDSLQYYSDKFGIPPIGYVAPENSMTDAGYQVLSSCGVVAVRGGRHKEQNNLHIEKGTKPGCWMNLKTQGIGDVQTTVERNQWIDCAIRDRKWVIEMWHNVSDENDGGFQTMSVSLANAHLKYIAQMKRKGMIWAASFLDAVKYLYEKEYVKAEAYLHCDREIAVVLRKISNDINWDVFQERLTVAITLPVDWRGCIIKNDRKQEARIEGETIYVNMLPGEALALCRDI